MKDGLEITLSEEEQVLLLMCMGYATGAAQKDGRYEMAQRFMHLTNRINEGNPDFTPYVWDETANAPRRRRVS